MYDKDDPRAALATATTTAPSAGAAAPDFADFAHEAPGEVSAAGSRTWYVRGQNFTLAYTTLKAGDSLDRLDQQHEYVVVLPHPQTNVSVVAGPERSEVTEPAVVVVPPGASTLTALEDTTVVRLFDSRSRDILDRAMNADSYREPHPNVAPLAPWPDPVDGHRLRIYPTENIPAVPGRFGRIFRTSSFMVNFIDPQNGPRDPEKLSPHHHDDFEQCSLAVEGEYVHHIRTPWTAKKSEWREDYHERIGSPSVTIIPPPTVHTSEAVSSGLNRLIDIFCPPREDFSAKDGWVLNAADYPQP